MSQLRPGMIRADTIDLQDRSQPSAKDHSASQLRDDYEPGVGRHRAWTLREVAYDDADEPTRRLPSARENGADAGAADRSRLYSDDSSHDDSDDDSSFGDGVGAEGGGGAGNGRLLDERRMNQQDALAIAQNGGAHDDDSDLDIDGDDLDDDMTGGISSSPSIEDAPEVGLPLALEPIDNENDAPTNVALSGVDFLKKRKELEKDEHKSADIDFEYVYALHTFVATVEGQANATKGDTMVLLDDSNSYWWLVRIVKDSSIGYLPAEHIETPTERLARLNKHRNIDLSATMLGDQQEKSKATFKTAIRRRKKTVTFSAPTYVDYSDVEYSTDEEDQEEIFARQQMEAQQAREQAREQAAAAESGQDDGEVSEIEDDSARVEPLKTRAPKEADTPEPTNQEQAAAEAESRPSSEDVFEGKPDGQSRSRNGTLRNTDSFFKDDSVETKKITLTPNLLRDDSTPRESTESKELRPRPSLDKVLEKDSPAGKEDKKKKEKDKKPSVIRNFFSRKDRKNRGSADDDEGLEKKSMESQTRDSRDEDADGGPNTSPQRHPSKLQKANPRREPSPTRNGGLQNGADLTYVPETRNDVSNVPPATMRIVDSETQETIEVASSAREDASRRSSLQSKPSPAVSADGEKQGAQPEPERPVEARAPADGAGTPALLGDNSSQEEHESASPSPEIHEEEESKEKDWDEAKLRAFFDSGSDVRDMLVVIYDKTDVVPAGPDHPIVGGLFREQNAKLAEITTQLDNMLGDWLARKQRMRGSI